jgi:hypothetical protein
MRTTILIVTTILMLLISASGNADESPDDKWQILPLIQGDRIDPSWVHIGYGGFAVDQGTLRTECDEQGMGLLLYKTRPFGNCRIRVVYRSKDPKSNAGVFVRIDPAILEKLNEKPKPIRREPDGKLVPGAIEQLMAASEKELGPWYAVHHGFEVQICNDADPFHRTGAIYSLAKAADLPKKSADWHTMVITLQEQRVLVSVDGKPVTSFDPTSPDVPKQQEWYEPKRESKRPAVGYIGLQNHDPGDVVWFKEISVQPLQ